jgi:two-component system, cell cycle response regulator DivK
MHFDPSQYNWSDYTILIAEDDVSSTFFLKEVLKDTEAEILHAPNGKIAVEICKKNPSISLILMDIKMPVINGYDATRAIRLFRPDLPIIAQTADATYNHSRLCIEAGCNDYISKPIDSIELLQKISAFLK